MLTFTLGLSKCICFFLDVLDISQSVDQHPYLNGATGGYTVLTKQDVLVDIKSQSTKIISTYFTVRK